jgi:hypothetical protein
MKHTPPTITVSSFIDLNMICAGAQRQDVKWVRLRFGTALL